jgi:hypothetical protein
MVLWVMGYDPMEISRLWLHRRKAARWRTILYRSGRGLGCRTSGLAVYIGFKAKRT